MKKIALVLEGGSMLGAYTSGVLDTFMKYNINFNSVYAISAGAKNSQYFISKQPGLAIKVDLKFMHKSKAISLQNLLFKGAFINRKYYDEYIMKEFAPLDMKTFNENKCLYYVGATNCLTGEIEYFEKSTSDIRDSVAASCSMPAIQKMCYINNTPYLDGCIAEGIPYKTALKDNDFAIIVLNRPIGFRAKPLSKSLIAIHKNKYKHYPQMLEQLLSSNDRYNQMLDEIEKLEKEGKVLVIRPTSNLKVKRMEISKNKLIHLYNLGFSNLKALVDPTWILLSFFLLK